MKKSIFSFILVAAAAVAMVGCKPGGGEGDDVTSVTIKPAEITLSEGDSYRLTATVLPEGTTKEKVWASSDTIICTVDAKGNIVANTVGSCNITCTVGDKTGVCKVTVKGYEENLVFTMGILWDFDDPAKDAEWREIEVRGEKYVVTKVNALFYLFSEGLFINNSGRFDGADEGAILEIEAPMFYADSAHNKGQSTVFSLGEYLIDADSAAMGYTQCAYPGKIADEANYIKNVVGGWSNALGGGKDYVPMWETAADEIKNARLTELEYNAEAGGYVNNYVPEGYPVSGVWYFTGRSTTYTYMYAMEYCFINGFVLNNDFENYLNGVKVKFNADTTACEAVDNEIHGRYMDWEFGEIAEAPARKHAPVQMVAIKRQFPEVAAQIKEQLDTKNLRKVNK